MTEFTSVVNKAEILQRFLEMRSKHEKGRKRSLKNYAQQEALDSVPFAEYYYNDRVKGVMQA